MNGCISWCKVLDEFLFVGYSQIPLEAFLQWCVQDNSPGSIQRSVSGHIVWITISGCTRKGGKVKDSWHKSGGTGGWALALGKLEMMCFGYLGFRGVIAAGFWSSDFTPVTSQIWFLGKFSCLNELLLVPLCCLMSNWVCHICGSLIWWGGCHLFLWSVMWHVNNLPKVPSNTSVSTWVWIWWKVGTVYVLFRGRWCQEC